MLKKVLLGTFILGVSAILIAGAVNRTSAKPSAVGLAGQNQTARGRQGSDTAFAAETNGAFQAQGVGQNGRSAANLRASANGKGTNPGNAGAPAEGDQRNSSANDPKESLTYIGVVDNVGTDSLNVALENGEELRIEGRAWRYAQESGIEIMVGDSIYLAGFEENGEFKIISMTDLTTFESVLLRSDSGRPMWAGGDGRNT